jgi:nucleoside-diphosphate-sugar epimerase
VFLIAEPELMSYEELQDRIGDLLHGFEWPTLRIPKSVAKAGSWMLDKIQRGDNGFIKPWMIDLADDHYPVEIRKAREKLGWEPKRSLRYTLEEMIRRLRRDPQQWYANNGLKPATEQVQPAEEGRKRGPGR